MEYNKAIRDKIPEIIKQSGHNAEIRKMTDDEFLAKIEKKLNEEVDEYQKDKDSSELVDIIEVIYRIAELRGISKEKLEEIRLKKVQEKDAFKENLFLIETNND